MIDTENLIEIIENNNGDLVSAVCVLRLGLRSSYIFSFDGDNLFYSGCDDDEKKSSLQEFKANYKDAVWIVTND